MDEAPGRAPKLLRTQCCIVGGGPAGMMLGYLMARAGVATVVLEKHADFLRDFRGDTLHPSTLRVVDELGLLDALLRRPHRKLEQIGGDFSGVQLRIADFRPLSPRYGFVALMPQWEFLDFIATQARSLPSFRLLMQAEAVELLEDAARVTGVRTVTPDGPLEVLADCTIGADGRHSTVRACAGFEVQDIGAPIDVLWFRVGRDGTDDRAFGHVSPGSMIVTLDRGDYWQCAFVIAKGGADALKARGLEAFRVQVATAAPLLAARVGDIGSWDDVKLLTVTIDRLRRWSKPGLLCIGDAAHAMSPVGGVGINLAIQDAVATANRLAARLRLGPVDARELDAVRQRRLLPVRAVQAMQVRAQQHLLLPAIRAGHASVRAPAPLRWLSRWPSLQRIPAWFIGIGLRSEHVRSPVAEPLPEIAQRT